MTIAAPVRSFRFTLLLDADSREDLANELRNIAWRVDADQISNGVSGGPSTGSIYELLHDPAQTHDAYHAQLRAYLAATKPPSTASHDCRLDDGRCGICGGDWSVCGCAGMLRRGRNSSGAQK